MTSTIDSASVTCMSNTLARMVPVRSDRTEMSMPGGIQRLISGISSLDAIDRLDDVGVGAAW